MNGAAPAGAHGENEAAALVRQMFARVAHRYDLANHVLSFNIDRWWRARAVQCARTILGRPGARALDTCCGTADLTLALAAAARCGSGIPACDAAFQRHQPGASPAEGAGSLGAAGAQVFGSDFCHPMLTAAREKIARARANGAYIALFEADALRLPVQDASLDLITAAFGFRNLANYDAGLREMRRVLRPGGMAAILEFSQPPNPVFRKLYEFYSRRILPKIGGALSGSPDAYAYLPESVRKFPGPEELAQAMRAAGFERVSFELLTGGIAALHMGFA